MIEDEEEVHLDTGIEMPGKVDLDPRSVLGTPYTHAIGTMPRYAFVDEAFGSFHQAAGAWHAFGGIGKLTTCKEEP